MATLSNDQLEFLKHHKVPLDRVFDATGMATSDYQVLMKKLDLWVAYGVTPCKAEKHTLRERKGHCIQCKPANLSYLLRHSKPGEIYVARSTRGRLTKIGSAEDAKARVGHLNEYAYGGQTDWFLMHKFKSARAGKVEFEAHRILEPHIANGTYFKDGSNILCRELFSCDVSEAVEAVQKALALFG